MASKVRRLGRRDFLKYSALAMGGAALAGCTPAPPAASTLAPAAPAAPAAAPTAAPKAAAPTAAAKAEPKLGQQLIGKLEGPSIVRDVSKFPKSFKEAPALAELVKSGKLPSVDKRLPEASELLVIQPVEGVGKY